MFDTTFETISNQDAAQVNGGFSFRQLGQATAQGARDGFAVTGCPFLGTFGAAGGAVVSAGRNVGQQLGLLK